MDRVLLAPDWKCRDESERLPTPQWLTANIHILDIVGQQLCVKFSIQVTQVCLMAATHISDERQVDWRCFLSQVK